MAETILNYLIWFAFTILAAIVTTILIPALSKWLTSKTQNEKLKALIADITANVQTSVNQLEQTAVTQLKEDGKWDSDAQRKVLNSAIDEVIANLLDTTKKTLESNGQDVQNVITRYIESYIQSRKELK